MNQNAERTDLAVADTAGTATSIVQVIERAASNPSVDVEKMERLLAMHERLLTQQNEVAFNVAMADAQSEIRRVAADSDNPQTRSRYASYAALDRYLRPIYTKHGFALSFDTGEAPENNVLVLCYVSHRAGHTRTYRALMPADGKGAKGGDVMTRTHAAGAAMQYGQRYLLKLIFNVAIGDDDDGNGADPLETITEQQAADLQCMFDEIYPAEEIESQRASFLRYLSKKGKLQMSKLEDIPAVMQKEAVGVLENKRKEKKAAK